MKKHVKYFPSRTQKRELREDRVMFPKVLVDEMGKRLKEVLNKVLSKKSLTKEEEIFFEYAREVAEYRELFLTQDSSPLISRKLLQIEKLRESLHKIGLDEERIKALNYFITKLSVEQPQEFLKLLHNTS
ncbi:MAG: hypothetical protein ACP5H7_01600 [Minisyncoccia bacterium]